MKRALFLLLLSASGVAHAEDGLPNTINKSDRIIGKLELGAGYHQLLSTSGMTKNVAVGVGSTTGRYASIMVVGRYEWGETPFDIGLRGGGAGVAAYFHEVRLRLGGSFEILHYAFERHTESHWVGKTGCALRFAATFDVLPWDTGALYVGADVHGTMLFPKTEWGPSVFVGLRL